jgi:hypothetical protein
MTEVRKRSVNRRPHHPSPCEKADIYAIKALSEGVATEGQQKRALAWILNTACGIRDNTYFADSERDSVFASGRRFVGLEIVALMNMPTSKLEGIVNE